MKTFPRILVEKSDGQTFPKVRPDDGYPRVEGSPGVSNPTQPGDSGVGGEEAPDGFCGFLQLQTEENVLLQSKEPIELFCSPPSDDLGFLALQTGELVNLQSGDLVELV